VGERFFIAVGELKPIPMPAHQARRQDLEKLTDEELLASVEAPLQGDWLVINSRTGLLYDGNGRANELLRRARRDSRSVKQARARRPFSAITLETLVPVEYYTPDYSMFPDLNT
jgi:hypothetical protein